MCANKANTTAAVGVAVRPLFPGNLLIMRAQIQTNLPLDEAVDQQADDGKHRQGGHPFRFLQPHGSDGRGVLDPTKTGFYGRSLVLIGLENLGICASLMGHRRGEDCPPIVLLGVDSGLDLDNDAIARLGRG